MIDVTNGRVGEAAKDTLHYKSKTTFVPNTKNLQSYNLMMWQDPDSILVTERKKAMKNFIALKVIAKVDEILGKDEFKSFSSIRVNINHDTNYISFVIGWEHAIYFNFRLTKGDVSFNRISMGGITVKHLGSHKHHIKSHKFMIYLAEHVVQISKDMSAYPYVEKYNEDGVKDVYKKNDYE